MWTPESAALLLLLVLKARETVRMMMSVELTLFVATTTAGSLLLSFIPRTTAVSARR